MNLEKLKKDVKEHRRRICFDWRVLRGIGDDGRLRRTSMAQSYKSYDNYSLTVGCTLNNSSPWRRL